MFSCVIPSLPSDLLGSTVSHPPAPTAVPTNSSPISSPSIAMFSPKDERLIAISGLSSAFPNCASNGFIGFAASAPTYKVLSSSLTDLDVPGVASTSLISAKDS